MIIRSNQHQRTGQQNMSNSIMEVLLGLMNLLMMGFSVDLTIRPMNLVLKDCNKSLSMINGSMNSQSCMLMTGQKNLIVKLVRGLWEIVHLRSDASRGGYVFSDMNPYVGLQNPLKEGQELFRKGLLSEAVLALEAEVMKNPENAEGWRLLGITHAENDDDQQDIAAMMRAQDISVHGACFNASEVTTGKTNDNMNDGMVEISNNERLDKMLEFLSKNIWEHVESDEFMEHVRQAGRVGDHVDNDHHGVRPLNPDPLIASARRVGDHVDSDHHGLCVPENMEDSQKL
ncbi:hypothetical protein ERO13_A08G253600v2 [Gossypium hirsutum]|uniref:Peroxisomal targeting signal 1 receptor isoform X1 n=1 Tax=Gossypium hirsutum TaxID=3635 RepID=A0A1U8N120_GOSHI|nr:peroxisomal targeting signal 1 receptor-like isoform X1 [Gossypium hirsutum]XP_040931327.1 peroxisomal targeting signal 1 receptor-like isoform X1 [Gossypium hirsutum]XP_040931328.1 peroxisomal targeting signal 1 receptor-like isoform X1 [Gossypium hirsutum]XP_040931329.1 peroxisomal targeting signal 1 receptor-like isoform X1 [Gossypium hirsutum]XP_040931330.1 peroxisomal targeting signal 1 receptor-like isoform X1 [Gossypium hirsutum]XP_040931331.1 peroxisomal targeting signal 1 receptor-